MLSLARWIILEGDGGAEVRCRESRQDRQLDSQKSQEVMGVKIGMLNRCHVCRGCVQMLMSVGICYN
jgi:hypothetical protein